MPHQPGAHAPSLPLPRATSHSGLTSSTVGSKTPLLQQQEEKEEGPRDDRLSTAVPCQAIQVPEATVNKWGLVAERLLDLAARPGCWLLAHPHFHMQGFMQHLLELHISRTEALYTIWQPSKEVWVVNHLLALL